MAEQVNQRIEEMINELEQMRRTNLYTDEEIREISRKRKEFEYKVQRRVKQKEDYVHYIAYELTLLEDISLRRKQAKLGEKRNDIEYSVAKRLNKLFKQFILRFQDDIEVYFEYIKFCRAVGFDYAISDVLGQMLQLHGDKPKTWQLVSKWEFKELNNIENARSFLLAGIKRHPECDFLYFDLFEIELSNALSSEEEEEKEKSLKRAEITWKNAVQCVNNVSLLFKLCDLAIKSGIESLINEIKAEIWTKRNEKETWSYIASKELEEVHWEEIEEYVDEEETEFPKQINYVIAIYEEALQQFPDKGLCTKYIHTLLGVSKNLCTDLQKIAAVKHAWMYGHENGLLINEMYGFGIKVLKIENETSDEEFMEILNTASKLCPQARHIWEEKLRLLRLKKQSMSILQEATKVLKQEDALYLWNLELDSIDSKHRLQNLYKKVQNCESPILLAIKPKLLQKMYDICGLKTARDTYEEFVKTPPTQLEVHDVMINLEKSQEKPNLKCIRKCYEYAVLHHGGTSVGLWTDYIKFETEMGSAQFGPAIYRRAVAVLENTLVDEFIKIQTLAKLK